MKRNRTEVYALAVCFVSMIGLGLTAVFAAHNTIGVLFPRFTLQGFDIVQFESDEAYAQWHSLKRDDTSNGETITARRLAELRAELARERWDRIHDLTICLLFLVVGVLLFWSHWRLKMRIGAARDVA